MKRNNLTLEEGSRKEARMTSRRRELDLDNGLGVPVWPDERKALSISGLSLSQSCLDDNRKVGGGC